MHKWHTQIDPLFTSLILAMGATALTSTSIVWLAVFFASFIFLTALKILLGIDFGDSDAGDEWDLQVRDTLSSEHSRETYPDIEPRD